jgi:Holliday junction resolvasome RuvABC DNA-binding subunit
MQADRARQLFELADDVRDMAERVIGNGPEPNYAGEKLAFAAERAISALVLLGAEPDEIARLVERAAQHGRWLAGRL